MSDFETTHWSRVLAAGGASTEQSREALAALCETYWYPLYVYLRRWGHDVEDAEDLTQGFFARVLEKDLLHVADPKCGRFRSFLLTSLKHYVANERDHAQAQKRGGNVPTLSLEFETARSRYLREPHDESTPESVLDRRWALTVLDRVLIQLRTDFRQRRKEALFERLKVHLVGGDSPSSCRETAAELGMSESAVRVAVHRLRRRFGELLRDEIGQTVAPFARSPLTGSARRSYARSSKQTPRQTRSEARGLVAMRLRPPRPWYRALTEVGLRHGQRYETERTLDRRVDSPGGEPTLARNHRCENAGRRWKRR